MAGWVWVLIIVGLIILIALVAWRALGSRRTAKLKGRFGPEYDRVAETAANRREAEAELAAREERREQLDIRPLGAEARRRYVEQWRAVQGRFVDSPVSAVASADTLVNAVMNERGYPMADWEQRAADISVDHPDVVDHYRQARATSRAGDSGDAGTEELRQAMRHYHALLDDLLDLPRAKPTPADGVMRDEVAEGAAR
jgi:hypothetical protein